MERIAEGQIFPTDPAITEPSRHTILRKLPGLTGPIIAFGLLAGATPALAEQPKAPTHPTSANNLQLPFSRNLVGNGDFSSGSLNWQSRAAAGGAIMLIDNHAGIDQSPAACMFFGQTNEAQWYQDIAVRRYTLYVLSGGLAVQTVNPSDQDGHGAFLSVSSLPENSRHPNQVSTQEVVGTTQPNYVQLREYYFSGNATQARVSIEMGSANALSTACGDNVSLSPF